MYSASVGKNKKDFDNTKMHGTTTKITMKLSGMPITGPRFEPWPLCYEADMTVNTKITI